MEAPAYGSRSFDTMRELAETMLRAAFPELFTDPPTAWLAPWDLTSSISGSLSVVKGDHVESTNEEIWARLRDEYLHPELDND